MSTTDFDAEERAVADAMAWMDPSPAVQRTMRLAVLADLEAEETSLWAEWWSLLRVRPVGGPLLAVVAVALVLLSSPLASLPLAVLGAVQDHVDDDLQGLRPDGADPIHPASAAVSTG